MAMTHYDFQFARARLSWGKFWFSCVFGVSLVPLSGNAETAKVRLWSPYDQASQAFLCLDADLEDWRFAKTEELGEPFIPHRLIDLPEGKYEDQIQAAADTGELPHFLLLESTQRYALGDVEDGPIFGADRMGLWVDEAVLATLPRATTALAGVWQGDPNTSLIALDDLLLLLAGRDVLPLGIDIGQRGEDLGLSLALMIEQWTPALDEPDMAYWDHPELFVLFETLDRWQREGLLQEVDFISLQRDSGVLPYLTFARFSAGQDLGAGYAFYPVFSTTVNKPASFLELPVHWHEPRSNEGGVTRELFEDIALGMIFDTCAETAGLLSYQQLTREDEGTILEALGGRGPRALPRDIPVEVLTWTGLRPDLPLLLTNVLRDIRAGLSIDNALSELVDGF